MPLFRYQGRTRSGKIKRGRLSGESRRDVTVALREKGIAATHIEEIKETIWNKDIELSRGVKAQDFVVFLRQFATLLSAGITVVDATALLAKQTESKPLKTALVDIEANLRSGHPFSESAASHKKIFPSLFINMLKAGELSGNMEESLERLANYFEKQHASREKIKSAMTYPITVSVIAIGVVIFMLAFIIPRFQVMFANNGVQLPLITRTVLNTSHWVVEFWWFLILVIVALLLAFYYVSRSSGSRYYLDLALLKVPIFGPLLLKAAIARFARTFSSLLASSVPILQAIDMVEDVVGNKVVEKVLSKTRLSVETGQPLADPMQESVFPPLVTQLITVGEKTGSLDTMLAKVADFYEAEVERTTDQMKALIEPVMIVILSGIVGVIVLSVVLPMFKLYNQIG